MTATKLTLSDYLALEEVFEGRREFVDGEIIEMPSESPQNVLISLFLLAQFLQLVPLRQLRRMDTELVVGWCSRPVEGAKQAVQIHSG